MEEVTKETTELITETQSAPLCDEISSTVPLSKKEARKAKRLEKQAAKRQLREEKKAEWKRAEEERKADWEKTKQFRKEKRELEKDMGGGVNQGDVFIPRIPFVFPKNTDEQIIEVKKKRKIKLDKKYYNSLTGFLFKIGQFFFKIIFYLIAFPLCRIRYHLKVEGRKNLKPYMKRLKKEGFITVSNHVFLWDYVALCASMRMGVPNVPAWGKIIYSKFGGLFSMAGVVPIPEDKTTFRKFYNFIDDILKHNKRNKWMHIYPETGLWYYYVPIRPFKKGAATFAYQYDRPIVPIGYSFRERTGLSRLWHKKHPYVTVHICPPIWPDKTKEKRVAVEELTNQARMAIMHAVGIKDEEENQRIMDEHYKYEDGHYYTNL